MSDFKTYFKDPKLNEEIGKYSRMKHLEKDQVLMSPGDKVVFMPIVTKGVLRVVRQNTEGKEVFLYHLYPAQTCAMAINCYQAHQGAMVKAIAEDDTDLILIPFSIMDDLNKYSEWKNFISATFASRFSELIDVIDLIAFNNMNKQVMHYLTERSKATNSKTLYITHQEIADELHTHREAISRLLRNLENKNMIVLGRNTIQIS